MARADNHASVSSRSGKAASVEVNDASVARLGDRGTRIQYAPDMAEPYVPSLDICIQSNAHLERSNKMHRKHN